MPFPATYRVGTVTVAANGTAVTGQGTNFLVGGIRAGDILAIRGLTVGVASVQSATALTLSDPWPGTTQTAQPYEIRYLGDPSRVLSATHAALAAFEAGGGTDGGPVEWGELVNVPATFPPVGHTHPWGQVTNKPASYPPSAHRHDASQIDNLVFTATWAGITDKPTVFPPAAHFHSWDELQDKPTVFPPSSHRHDASQIDNLPAAGATYATRQALAAAVGNLAVGAEVSVRGITAIVDPTAIGNASALHDLGVNGVRLIGRIIPGAWFGVEDGATNAVAAIHAADTYAKAQKGGTNAVKLVLAGAVTVDAPITLGGASNALYHIDWSALTLNAATGGTLTASTFAITIEAANSIIHCGRVNANKVCNGIRFTNCGNSQAYGPNVRRYTQEGVKVSGNSAGMRVEAPTTTEWLPTDPEYIVEAEYIGKGFVADSADFTLTGGQCGWCKYALFITSNAGGFEAHGFHPYNGDITASTPRQHPYCVVNEATGPAYLYNCYIDNGYIDDRTGKLHIQGGWHLTLGNRVNLAQPYVRIKMPADPTNYEGSITDFDSSIGFYTGAWVNAGTNLVTDITSDPAGQRGPSRISEVGRRRSRIIPASGDTVDDYTAKQGASGTVIRQRYQPGSVVSDRLDVEVYSGKMRLLNPSGNGEVVLANTRTGIAGEGNRLDVYTNGVHRAVFPDNGGFRPATDNAHPLGALSTRWSTVYSGTGTINTSDARLKQNIRDLSDAERAVAARIRSSIRAYRFRDAVEAKGDAARWHIGVIAQEVIAAFEDEGLDPYAYGVVCHDEWPADGETEAGDRYGIRYDELAMFLMVAA